MPEKETNREILKLLEQRMNDLDKKLSNELMSISKKLDLLLDPQKGVFIQIHDNAKSIRAIGEKTDKLQRIVFGNGDRGLDTRVKYLEDFNDSIKKYFFRMVTPILGALGILKLL